MTIFASPVVLLLLALILPGSALRVGSAADSGWNKVSEGTFELYTADDPKQAAQLLLTFARMRLFFAQAAPFQFSDQSRLEIIAFHSEKEFAQYRINAGSCAFYQQTGKGEYVVLQDLSAEHREVSAHEFTHFIIAHSSLRLPLWLNEGMADLYSTLNFSENEATVGKAVPGRLQLLRRDSWLPLSELFEVGTNSTYYSEPEKMALFYSESWALTHMLALSPAYAARFPEFLRAISEGHPAAESLRLTYNKTLDQVQTDLHASVDQRLPVLSARVDFGGAASATFHVSPVAASDVDLALSELSLSNPNSRADIQNRLASAATRYPTDARAEEALGFMAMRQGNSTDARAHFQKAVERGSGDSAVFFNLAYLDHEAGVPDEQVLALLRHAVELKPNYYEANLELGLIAASGHDYQLAIDSLVKLGAPRPEHLFTITYSLAYCYTQLDKLAEARKYAAEANRVAASISDKTEVADLLSYIEQEQQNMSDRGEVTPVTK